MRLTIAVAAGLILLGRDHDERLGGCAHTRCG